MATYVNDLRLKEIATGDESGTWGASTNTNLELIGEALGYNTQDCFSSDADATTTVADGVSDPARAMYFKVTSSATLTATRTLTVGPNTISRVMFIENATTGSQSITISQGSGANVTISNGRTTVVYLDGAGASAAVVDALALVDPGVTDTLAETLVAGNTSGGTSIIVSSGDDLTLTGTSANAIWDSSDSALEFADNAKAVFGTGGDLEVYHDASNSIINDTGTGNLQLQTGGSTKLEITSTGLSVTGTAVLPTVDIDAGAIDGTTVGAATPAAGTFTTLTANTSITGTLATAAQANITSVGTLTSLAVSGDLTVDTNTLKVDSTNNRVGVLNASPAVSLDAGSATDAFHVPVGTTAQRPSGAAGHFRYNTTLEQFEGYTDDWGQIGGGGGANAFATDSYTGDGSTTAYALSQVVVSEDNLLVFIEGVFQQQDAYSIATAGGTTTLTFSAAPANGNDILIYSVVSAISGTNLNSDTMTGDGSDTTLTLSLAPVNENNTQVYIDGVYQNKDTYSISGTTLTFSAAPPNGSAVEVMTMNQLDINTPTDGSVTPAKIASGDFYFDTNTLYIDATNNRVGIGTSSPATRLDVASTGEVVSTVRTTSTSGARQATLRLNVPSTGGDDPAGRVQFTYGTGYTVAGSIEMSHTNNNMKFLTGTTERMRIDASGDVFIGTTTSTGNPLTVQADSGAAAIGIKGRVSDGIGTMSLYANDGTTPHGYIQGRSAEFRVWGESGRALLLGAGAAEGARIDTSGNLLVGKTSNTFSTPGFVANANGMSATRSGGACVQINRTSSDGTIQEFYKDGTLVGSISTNANSLPSDRNFKRNIQDLSLGLNFISSLEPVTYNYKIDDDGAPVMAGLIAQDVEIALSAAGVEANSMTLLQHNPTEDEKESDYQLDYLKLVPVLINAVKELTERLEQLENN